MTFCIITVHNNSVDFSETAVDRRRSLLAGLIGEATLIQCDIKEEEEEEVEEVETESIL